MQKLLSDAGRSFLRAFAGSLIVLAPGILAAPNLNRAVAIGIAAVIASIAAGLKTLQAYVPRLSFVPYLPAPAGALADSFSRAFIAAFLTSVIGIFEMPNLSTAKSLVVAALVGAITAGIRGLQGALTTGEAPFGNVGIQPAPAATPAAAAPGHAVTT